MTAKKMNAGFLLCRWFLGLRWSKNLLCLGQRINFVLAWDSCVGGENETESEAVSFSSSNPSAIEVGASSAVCWLFSSVTKYAATPSVN